MRRALPYNTLTKRPKGYGVHPIDAASMMERIEQRYELVALSPSETLHAISQAAETGLVGSLIYDALLIACARKINARAIYTRNIKHLRQIASDLATRILLP